MYKCCLVYLGTGIKQQGTCYLLLWGKSENYSDGDHTGLLVPEFRPQGPHFTLQNAILTLESCFHRMQPLH